MLEAAALALVMGVGRIVGPTATAMAGRAPDLASAAAVAAQVPVAAEVAVVAETVADLDHDETGEALLGEDLVRGDVGAAVGAVVAAAAAVGRAVVAVAVAVEAGVAAAHVGGDVHLDVVHLAIVDVDSEGAAVVAVVPAVAAVAAAAQGRRLALVRDHDHRVAAAAAAVPARPVVHDSNAEYRVRGHGRLLCQKVGALIHKY